MAISIYEEWGFEYRRISDFLDGDSGQLDPCLVAIKRIDQICYYGHNINNLTDNLELADKASARIEKLSILKK